MRDDGQLGGMTADEKLLDEARRRFRMCVDAEREIREEAEKDLEFLAGEQWNPARKRERELAHRPALVFNKLPTYVQHVSNQARQNKPAIKVHPVDSAADPDIAKVNQGIIRHIEYDSNADTAYDTALLYAAACSFGYFGYTTEYTEDEDAEGAAAFDQDIKCIRIEDPMTVYLDPDSKEPDGSDAMFAFKLDRMSREAFEEKYGEIDAVGDTFGDELAQDGWILTDSVRVAEYWRVEITKRTLRLVQGEDGIPRKSYTDQEDYDPDANFVLDEDGKPLEREAQQRQVCQYVINGAKVLEKNKWKGRWIPIVRVLGQELWVKGKKKLFSVVRFVRDPQQLLNYYKTTEAETIGLAPKPKWIGYLGQFKTKMKDWARANIANLAFLEADPVTVNGNLAPLPRWETFEPPVQALSIGAAQCVDDIKAGTGIFDPSLGSQARETSGIAIQRRKMESDVSNFHFIDNLSKGQRFGGRILLDLIRKIYDTAREVRIIGEDEKQRVVKVNAPWIDEHGKQQHYRLDVGKYDVTVSTGPSYTTQRQEAFDLLTQMAQGDPEIMQIGGDIIFRNSDIPGGDELAERWKRKIALSAPGLIQDDENKKDIPVGVQMQLAQGQQIMQQMQAEIQQLTQIIQTKQVENSSKERIAEMQSTAAIVAAELKNGNDHTVALMREDFRAAVEEMKAARQSDLAEGQQAHEQTMQARDQAHQQGMQAQDQQHQAGMQDQQLQAQAEQQPPAGR